LRRKARRNSFILHKTDQQFQPRFLTFPFGNKLHLNMPVLEESRIGDFGAPIPCHSGLCGMFLLMFKRRAIKIQHNNCL